MSSRPSYVWFSYSLALAPGLTRERMESTLLPELPEGEVAAALDVELLYDVPAPRLGRPRQAATLSRAAVGPGPR